MFRVAKNLPVIRVFVREMFGTRCGPVGTRFSLILGTRIVSLKHLKKPRCYFNTGAPNFHRTNLPLRRNWSASTRRSFGASRTARIRSRTSWSGECTLAYWSSAAAWPTFPASRSWSGNASWQPFPRRHAWLQLLVSRSWRSRRWDRGVVCTRYEVISNRAGEGAHLLKRFFGVLVFFCWSHAMRQICLTSIGGRPKPN